MIVTNIQDATPMRQETKSSAVDKVSFAAIVADLEASDLKAFRIEGLEV